MTQPPLIRRHELPCPTCGYDLRATPQTADAVCCPECGIATPLSGPGNLTRSRIPWLARHSRGRLLTFLATLYLALVRPEKLARELEIPARPKDARLFHTICLILSTIIATLILEIAMNNWNLNFWLPGSRTDWQALSPAIKLHNHFYGLLVLSLGIYLATWACLSLYRHTISIGSPRFMRRRLAALAGYSAGLIMAETVALGLLLILWLGWINEDRHHPAGQLLKLFTLVSAAIAVLLYLWPALGFALRTGRERASRARIVLFYPVVAIPLWIVIVIAVNWTFGFLILGIRSMST